MVLKFLHIAEEIKNHSVSIKYVNTKDNIADIFTKPLPYKTFVKLTENQIY